MPVEFFGEDAIPIIDYKSLRMIVRRCLPDLLQDPFRSRMGRYVLVKDSAGSQVHQHKDVQRLERRPDHDEEVARRGLILRS